MASVFISSPAEIVVVDSRTRSGTITLPNTNFIPYRVLSFKDQYGTFSNSSLTLSTQLGESFDDGTTSKTFSNAFSYLNLYAVSSKWLVMNATQTVQQTISSLTVNQLTFGTGAGWVQFGPVQASIVSTIQEQTNAAYINNLYIGTQSTLNTAQYWGLFGNYNNTVLAEISTGTGFQEFLVFKGSSSSDRVRVQTTGNFVVETGVSARLFNSNTTTTLSNATPAFIINTSSNVGIQTATPGATLDVAGTARAITLSTQQLLVSSLNGSLPLSLANLTSTTAGITTGYQTAGFLSSLNLLSTVGGLGSIGYISSPSLTSSFISTTNFIIQSFSSFSTAFGPGGGINTAQLTSTVGGLGSIGYISSATLISTTAGLERYVSSFIDPQELASSVLQFISSTYFTTQLNSTVTGLGSIGYISSSQLTSTTAGITLAYQTAGFISSANLLNMVSTPFLNTSLTSTVTGLGSIGYISTASLTSSFISTTNFINQSFSSFSTAFGPGGGITTAQLASTVTGLGSIGYLSSIPAILSTSAFYTSSAVISTATIRIMSSLITNASTVTANIMTTSTIATNGLTMGTNPSWILTSPIQTLAISTNSLWADQSYVNTETVTTGTISTLTTNALTLGTGATWIQTAPILTSVVSTINLYANQPFFDTVNIGSVSTMNSLEYYGLFGNYNNTVLAEISTGGGNQELLIFKGSSSSDRVRVQTTGNFVIETGVSARLFNSNTSQTLANATPAFIVNSSSNVGIQTASPGATLDVAGTARAVTVSSQQLFFSSLNGGQPLSSANLISTTAGITTAYQTAGFISSANLANMVSTSFLDTSLASTTTGITIAYQTAGFLSSANLLNLVSTTFLNTSLASTTAGITTAYQTAGFISSANLANMVSTSFLNTSLTSTVTGLGSSGYLSSIPTTLSTSSLFVSSISTNFIQAVVLSSLALYASSLVAPYVFSPQFFTF